MDNGKSNYYRFLEGDNEAFNDIIREYGAHLILFINGYVRNMDIAEDLMEDTFCELVFHKSRLKKEESFKSYLFSIAKNKAVNYLRKSKRLTVISIDECHENLPDEVDIENKVIKNSDYRELYEAMEKLCVEYRQVLYLHYFELMTYDTIAKVMNKNKNQIKNLMYRAKKELEALLKTELKDYEK